MIVMDLLWKSEKTENAAKRNEPEGLFAVFYGKNVLINVNQQIITAD